MPSDPSVYRCKLQHNNIVLKIRHFVRNDPFCHSGQVMRVGKSMIMKRIPLYISAVLLAVSCSGTVDPDNQQPDNIPEEYTEPFTLSADKTEVEASGKDYVTFSLKDAYGRDLMTDKNALQGINVVSEEGQRVARMETMTRFIDDGTYNFSATYKGRKCENTVQITARNRSSYEKYHKNVAIYKATATWCGPCAYMTRALEGMNEVSKNHSVELCWHYQDELALEIPGSDYDCGTFLVSYFNGSGVPTVILDLKETVIEKASSALDNAIWELRAEHPATCGIKAEAAYNQETGKIDVCAHLTSSTGGSYDLGLALLLNNQVIPSGTNDDGKYSHIVRAATGNYFMYSDAIAEVAEDEEISMTQNIDPLKYDIDDLSVAVFALVKDGEGARIDNIIEVKVGESVDYMLN